VKQYVSDYAHDYADEIRQSAWLVSAEVTVVSAVLAAISLAILRVALHPGDQRRLRPVNQLREDSMELIEETQQRYRAGSAASFLKGEDEARQAERRCAKPALISLGLLLYFVSYLLTMLVLIYTRVGTVATLRVVEVVSNVPLAYGVLGEKFTKRDLIATSCCIGSMVVALIMMPKDVPDHLLTFPADKFKVFLNDPSSDYGFTAYWISWTVLTVVCMNANWVVRSGVRKHVHAFTMPVLSGLFASASAFLVKLAATLIYHSDSFTELWYYWSTHALIGGVLVALVLSLHYASSGVRMFECRYFVPASYAVTSVLMVVQGWLFFDEWKDMSPVQAVCFIVAGIISLASVCFIPPEHDVSAVLPSGLPSTDAEAGSLIDKWPTPEELEVLTTMEEHNARAVQTSKKDLAIAGEPSSVSYADLLKARQPLVTSCSGKLWNQVCRIHPLFIFILFPLTLLVFWTVDYVWEAFLLLTLYSVYTVWKFGLHVALFANVGRMKVEAYQRVEFKTLYHKMATHPESPEAKAPFAFEDVMHFIILTNYKEDVDIMKEAIISVAASTIATRQICMVLACEEREPGINEKAEKLIEDVGGQFKHMIYTLHPPGIAGEVPGKSSNCRWAAKRVMEEYLPKFGYDVNKTIFTVMDADSEFHSEYFSALSYQFLTAPSDTERFNTIWQAPIVHYKNYYSQPAVVRLASLLTGQHELANLADTSATKLPYSTYSISAVLAEGVDGWDPDWISEDWHMCCKCYCGTVGLLRIVPIFLPIMNYTPEGDGWWDTIVARWTQAKRHALGVSELVYFMGTAPYVSRDPSFTASRRAKLALRGYFLWLKMLFVHLMMAAAVIISPFNGMIIHNFYRNHRIEDVNSFCFLVNSVFQFIGAGAFLLQVFTSMGLYDTVSHRIVGSDEPANIKWWGRHHYHFLSLLIPSIPNFFFLFAMGGMAEWIAAVKTAFTHKFHYEVALKPSAASTKVQPS